MPKDCVPRLIADHLLANGVIVPPCKVGDTVCMVTTFGAIREMKVHGAKMTVGINGQGAIFTRWCFLVYSDAIMFNDDDIGKTVFLTREEAEQALKEKE
jgi:hypothetical protein